MFSRYPMTFTSRYREGSTPGIPIPPGDAPDPVLRAVSPLSGEGVGGKGGPRAFQARTEYNPREPRSMTSLGAVFQSVATKVLIIGINALTGIITARALR